MSAGQYEFQFVAGNLALDFVNTVSFRLDREKVEDRLQSSDDLRRWAKQAGLTDRFNGFSASTLSRIRSLREQLCSIFGAIANNQPIPAEALRKIDAALHACRAQRRLAAHGKEIRWIWRAGAEASDVLLFPILTAATDLLTSGARDCVRQCAGEGCGWLFLDRSNAGKRRWCRMADCGNRNKAREHYRRKAGLA